MSNTTALESSSRSINPGGGEVRPYPKLMSRLRTAAVLILLCVVLIGGASLGGIYAWGSYSFLIFSS